MFSANSHWKSVAITLSSVVFLGSLCVHALVADEDLMEGETTEFEGKVKEGSFRVFRGSDT